MFFPAALRRCEHFGLFAPIPARGIVYLAQWCWLMLVAMMLVDGGAMNITKFTSTMVDPRFHAGYMCIGGVSNALVTGAHGGQLVAASSEQPGASSMLYY
jgi:hypothetical protein